MSIPKRIEQCVRYPPMTPTKKGNDASVCLNGEVPSGGLSGGLSGDLGGRHCSQELLAGEEVCGGTCIHVSLCTKNNRYLAIIFGLGECLKNVFK